MYHLDLKIIVDEKQIESLWWFEIFFEANVQLHYGIQSFLDGTLYYLHNNNR